MPRIAPRGLLQDFSLDNKLYAGAHVHVFDADVATGAPTSVLARVYRAAAGADEMSNPIPLLSSGRWQQPPYVDRPVVMRISGAEVPNHDTGISNLQSAFRGDWAAGVTYTAGDIARDGAAGSNTGNLYIADDGHTAAATWFGDLGGSRWLLYLSSSTPGSGAVPAALYYKTPEEYGAVGDGISHPAESALGVSTLGELRAYKNGVFGFADSIHNEMDYLGIQAAFYAGGIVVGRPGAVYKIDHNLVHPNGHVQPHFASTKLSFENFAVISEGANLLTNPSFSNGATGWAQGTLTPRTDIIFAGDKASFTDPAIGAGANYGDFGQQVTLTVGKWTISVRAKLSPGGSSGFYGPPYINIGFRPYGVGLGSYDWPHPLSFGYATTRDGIFDDWLRFDVEVLENTIAWLDIQGGNCNWEIQEVEIKPFLMNYAVWCTGDNLGFGARYDVSLWSGGELIGPVSGNPEDGWEGPVVGGVLHKSFRGEGPRCNFEQGFIFGFDVGMAFSDQAFLNHITATNIGNCRTCVKFLRNATNAGENFRFARCVIFNSDLAFHAEGGGEWNFWGCSFDFCRRLVLAERGAKISFLGHHFEFNGSETRLYLTSPSGVWSAKAILTGGTSGATGRVLIARPTRARPHLVVEVLTGTFSAGEAITCASGGSATANGAVEFGPYMFELTGGSYIDFSGEFLQSGGAHRGALHMFKLTTNADVWSNVNWWAYGLHTVSDTLCTGSGRFVSSRLLGPGNAQLPRMIMRNQAMDAFAGNGRIAGPGSLVDMGFPGPPDNIGLIFGAHSEEASGAASKRGLIPWEHEVSANTTVARGTGYGSLRLQYNAAYSGNTEVRIYIPVQPGAVVCAEYWYSKPDVKPPVARGPYTAGAGNDSIWVNTIVDSAVATVQDNQTTAVAQYGPQTDWTVTLAGVTGNPGGVSNAVWNNTHTIIKRTDNQYSDNLVRYTINLGTSATSTANNSGGNSIETSYSQTNVLIFDRRFWTKVLYNDTLGRPVLGQTSFQGELNVLIPHAALDWTPKSVESWYTEPVVLPGNPLEDRGANGRAPEWATHFMFVINYPNIRFVDAAAPPPLYLADFYANVI